MIRPAPLEPGDAIQLIAPASAPRQNRTLLAARRLQDLGYRVVVPDGFFDRTGYLAGSDQIRADEINAAFADDDVDAIFPITGGYGTTRILGLLDYDTIAANPKIFIGFSDITALHIAIQEKARLATFHTPNPQYGLGSDSGLHPFAERCFWRALRGPDPDAGDGPGYTIHARHDLEPLPEVRPRTIVGGKCVGPVIGGNLAVVAALIGTPYAPDTAGKILFLEDTNEAPYRIDRMLRQLKDAGKLDRVAGVLLGRFTKADVDEDGHTVDDVFDDYFSDAPYPVVAHFPAGHVHDNGTIPFGVPAELDAGQFTLTLLGEPTQSGN